jgi:DNA-damage-inducible protein J
MKISERAVDNYNINMISCQCHYKRKAVAMIQQSLIQIRVDRPLKEEVASIFSSLGIDMSTAVRVFFQQCRKVKGIPFALTLADEHPKAIAGKSKGKWSFPKDWEKQDKALDKEIEAGFYADIV